MDALQAQCKDADKYPLNMSLAGQPKYTVDLRHRRLRDDANRLFKADKGFLEFLEFSEGGKGFWNFPIYDTIELRQHLAIDDLAESHDPCCRYLFVSAPNSRDRLNVTYSMLMLCFTYLQVMPEFIDFLLIFGRQTRAQHFHFCAFKQRTRLASCKEDFSAYGLKIPSIGWSGRDLQLCYNLKSMETSSQGGWPWSVRDCVINHSFDLEKVRCTWIVIKGNALIQDRIRTATKYQSPSELSSFQSTDRSFASTLATHSIIANWAAENWDIYITFVEARFHEVSCRAITNEIDISGSPTIVEENAGDSVPRYARTDTGRSSKSIMSLFSRTFLNVFDTSSSSSTGHGEKNSKSQPMSHMKSGLRQPRPPSISAKTRKVEFETRGQQFISVSDLQILHTLHERTNESVLVLQLNIKMMSSLVDFYRNTLQSPYFPESILSNSRDDFAHFKSTLQEVQYDLETHILRLNTLAGYIVECKTLLSGILDHQNTQSNKLLAKQSSFSTLNMERMADEMNHIARKTRTETVSMKVITLVTLFFLPGTFISTLMSTDVFQDHESGSSAGSPYNNLNPLQFYFTLSVPLTVLTLLVWACLYQFEIRRAQMEEGKFIASKMA